MLSSVVFPLPACGQHFSHCSGVEGSTDGCEGAAGLTSQARYGMHCTALLSAVLQRLVEYLTGP